MKLPILPQSRTGRASLLFAFFFVMTVAYAAVSLLYPGLRLSLAQLDLLVVVSLGLIVLSLASAFAAVARSRDRAIALRAVMVLGMVTMLLLLFYSLYVGD